MNQSEQIYEPPVVEVESRFDEIPGVMDGGPYRVSLQGCGMTITIETPFGGRRATFATGRIEANFETRDWPRIVAAVEAVIAENQRRAVEQNRLDDLIYGEP